MKPQLEYCVHCGVPQFKKFFEKLELTRVVRGQEHLMFEERQTELGLSSLSRFCLGFV